MISLVKNINGTTFIPFSEIDKRDCKKFSNCLIEERDAMEKGVLFFVKNDYLKLLENEDNER